jgi:hypothetical protein
VVCTDGEWYHAIPHRIYHAIMRIARRSSSHQNFFSRALSGPRATLRLEDERSMNKQRGHAREHHAIPIRGLAGVGTM